ncbi:hypothetical protein EVAR_82693_1 [Eumeta japonica]|uniref:Uncharacterized protein n=1 Tax=Eumeta variegata TaxID=151549 RepID=A0A4C1V9X0_EUMVA|nr:hypothetical protein EVAR_82693_1 [Eumeta japonica]
MQKSRRLSKAESQPLECPNQIAPVPPRSPPLRSLPSTSSFCGGEGGHISSPAFPADPSCIEKLLWIFDVESLRKRKLASAFFTRIQREFVTDMTAKSRIDGFLLSDRKI